MRKWQGRLPVDCCHGLRSEAFIRASVRWTDAVAAGFHGAGIRAFSALYLGGDGGLGTLCEKHRNFATESSVLLGQNLRTFGAKVPYFFRRFVSVCKPACWKIV